MTITYFSFTCNFIITVVIVIKPFIDFFFFVYY